jgi:hypothetical protein
MRDRKSVMDRGSRVEEDLPATRPISGYLVKNYRK